MQVVDHHRVAVAALSMFPQMRMSFGQIGVFMRQNLRLCRRPELQRARNPEEWLTRIQDVLQREFAGHMGAAG